jgi:hypothetical protein
MLLHGAPALLRLRSLWRLGSGGRLVLLLVGLFQRI